LVAKVLPYLIDAADASGLADTAPSVVELRPERVILNCPQAANDPQVICGAGGQGGGRAEILEGLEEFSASIRRLLLESLKRSMW